MIIKETNKINHKEVIRVYSDSNNYIKIEGTDELLTEKVYNSEDKINIIETDIEIEQEEIKDDNN
jgi:hypothetical protein